jgi:hypothetical protein
VGKGPGVEALNEPIKTDKGPHLLHVGDVIAFPESGLCATVTQTTDAGIRLEFIEWLLGTPHHEEVWSWRKVFECREFRVYGDGYDADAAIRDVRSATVRTVPDDEFPGLVLEEVERFGPITLRQIAVRRGWTRQKVIKALVFLERTGRVVKRPKPGYDGKRGPFLWEKAG